MIPHRNSLLSDAKYFDEGAAKSAEVRKLLDSNDPKDKLEAMKRLMALMSMGRDVSSFFVDVVKCIVVNNYEVKKLVYMFLTAHSENTQDLALLSISSFQRDLTSPSQLVRGTAMRAMSSIRVPIVAPLIILSLKKAVKDNSPYVRRSVATSLPKILSLDESQYDSCVEILTDLLTNIEPQVLSAAMYAYSRICPENYELIHPHFRKICHLLADLDEYAQIITLQVLTRYGRLFFIQPQGYDVHEASAEDLVSDSASKSTATSPNNNFPSVFSSSVTNTVTLPHQNTFVAKPTILSKFMQNSTESFYDDEPKKNTKISKKADLDSESSESESEHDDDLIGDDMDDFLSSAATSAKKQAKENRNIRIASRNMKLTGKDIVVPSQSPEESNLPVSTPSTLMPTTMDPDHIFLVRSAAALLRSNNSGVIVAVASLFEALAPTIDLPVVAKALVRTSRNVRYLSYVVYVAMHSLSIYHSSLFRPYYREFFLNPTDPRYLKDIKLELLLRLCDKSNSVVIMHELCAYTRWADPVIIAHAVTAMTHVCAVDTSLAPTCLKVILSLLGHSDVIVSAQVLITIRILSQRYASDIPVKVLKTLAKLIINPGSIRNTYITTASSMTIGDADVAPPNSSSIYCFSKPVLQSSSLLSGTLKKTVASNGIVNGIGSHCTAFTPSDGSAVYRGKLVDSNAISMIVSTDSIANSIAEAKVALIWTLGEHLHRIPKYGPDILRILVRSFSEEPVNVRLQILNLAVKGYVLSPNTFALLFKYTIDLAKVDANVDVRDRARVVRALFYKKKSQNSLPVEEQQAIEEAKKALKTAIHVAKPAGTLPLKYKDRARYILGSISQILITPVYNYKLLPSFATTPSDPSIRTPYIPSAKPVTSPTPQTHHVETAVLASTRKSDSFYDDDIDEKSEDSGSEDEMNFTKKTLASPAPEQVVDLPFLSPVSKQTSPSANFFDDDDDDDEDDFFAKPTKAAPKTVVSEESIFDDALKRTQETQNMSQDLLHLDDDAIVDSFLSQTDGLTMDDVDTQGFTHETNDNNEYVKHGFDEVDDIPENNEHSSEED